MLTAAQIMTREVVSVSPELSVDDLAKRFVETSVSAMPVIDGEGRLCGIVSETDLVEQDRPLHIPTVVAIFDVVVYLESEKKFREQVEKMTARTVGEICQKDVVMCAPETSVPAIAGLMTEHKVNLLPVVEKDRVVGVVSRHDIIRAVNTQHG